MTWFQMLSVVLIGAGFGGAAVAWVLQRSDIK